MIANRRPATALKSPVQYADSLETQAEGEQETIARIVQAMKAEMDKVRERDHETVRASHAKSTGVVKGALHVLGGLPPELAQGLFAAPASYEALVRFAQGPGERLSDSVSTHRGMAVKLVGVPGATIPGHDAPVQDFVFATGTAFAQGSAATFLLAMKGIEKSTGLPEIAKQAVSTAMRAANAVVQAAGSYSPTFGFFGHTKRNPLADAYFSQAPLRFGDHVAKLGFFPVSSEQRAIADETIDTGADHDGFRTALVAHMLAHGAEFELRCQLCRDLERMPVEDASIQWPEDDSPYLPVARLTLPPQAAYSPARQAYFDQRLSFRPSHSLAAHRPLGSIMRARMTTYRELAQYRRERNGAAGAVPDGIADVPD